MTDAPLWSQIADALRADLSAIAPGTKLPTEAQLAARFGVNRHTIRRALAALTEEGLVHTRRGAGVFAALRPLDYPLTRRPRFHAALSATGRMPGRRVLDLQSLPADAEMAALLDVPEGAPILRLEGLSLSEGTVIGHFCATFPPARVPGLEAALRANTSITAALAACGVQDYARDWTRLTALRASRLLAQHLHLAPGDPVLRSEALSRDAQGRPIEHAITHFAGNRISLLVKPE
ncbi:MAG: phosphonate metabolism transcriptional regulator PhnF [Roseinatronobacter sp.]